MIRSCDPADFAAIFEIINDAAEAYRGVIPADRWHEPYMPEDQLAAEIEAGVAFHGLCEGAGGRLIGVMGIQPVKDVSLIRHAYVRTSNRQAGVGAALLAHLQETNERPLLVGTWKAAAWAIRFYEKHGFEAVTEAETVELLRRYWDIPARQVETSVVLADRRWLSANR